MSYIPKGRVPIRTTIQRWGIRWCSQNYQDKEPRVHLMFDRGKPLLFHTRQEARDWIRGHYGYLKTRRDLTDPKGLHGWKMPSPVKVNVTLEERGR